MHMYHNVAVIIIDKGIKVVNRYVTLNTSCVCLRSLSEIADSHILMLTAIAVLTDLNGTFSECWFIV